MPFVNSLYVTLFIDSSVALIVVQCAQDAERAEREGKGIVILGRPCRTEMTRGQGLLSLTLLSPRWLTNLIATFIVCKISGQPTYPEEATRLLEKLGAIAKAERLPASIQQEMGIGPGILVTFEMYDTKRDVVGVSLLCF